MIELLHYFEKYKPVSLFEYLEREKEVEAESSEDFHVRLGHLFSHLSVHKNPLKGSLRHSLLGTTPQFLIQLVVGLENLHLHFDDANAAGIGTTL